MRTIAGHCHCVNITYDFDWPVQNKRLPARACSCSFCRAHGAVYTSHPKAALVVQLREPELVNRYRFGHGSADFIVCRVCGVIVLAVCTIDESEYAVLNINTFAQPDIETFDHLRTDFEGETEIDRLARRKRNWIGTVHIK